ncbi:hypothetical protein F4779DRAFT_30176 [Xylariaceae sp. FL0662B]|nr:hypothetical protein F4779DRAFT_30176 [Xylariaceae sp. FL0662B]
MAPLFHAMSPEHIRFPEDTQGLGPEDLSNDGFLDNDPYETVIESSANVESESRQRKLAARTTERREIDARVRAQPNTVSPDGSLALPLDGEILVKSIESIDSRHCFKYKWYIARHLRQTLSTGIRASQQSIYYHVVKGHDFTKKKNGGWTLNQLSATPFKRLHFEATRAYLHCFPNWKHPRVFLVLAAAPQVYAWNEIVTDDTVNRVLGADGVDPLLFDDLKSKAAPFPTMPRNLALPEPPRDITTSPAPTKAPNREGSPILGSDDVDLAGEDDDISVIEIPDSPLITVGDNNSEAEAEAEAGTSAKKFRVGESKPTKRRSIELFREETLKAREAKRRTGQGKQGRRAGRQAGVAARKTSKKQRRWEEKKAQLDALHREYVKDLGRLTRKYHRKRLAIEQLPSGL